VGSLQPLGRWLHLDSPSRRSHASLAPSDRCLLVDPLFIIRAPDAALLTLLPLSQSFACRAVHSTTTSIELLPTQVVRPASRSSILDQTSASMLAGVTATTQPASQLAHTNESHVGRAVELSSVRCQTDTITRRRNDRQWPTGAEAIRVLVRHSTSQEIHLFKQAAFSCAMATTPTHATQSILSHSIPFDARRTFRHECSHSLTRTTDEEHRCCRTATRPRSTSRSDAWLAAQHPTSSMPSRGSCARSPAFDQPDSRTDPWPCVSRGVETRSRRSATCRCCRCCSQSSSSRDARERDHSRPPTMVAPPYEPPLTSRAPSSVSICRATPIDSFPALRLRFNSIGARVAREEGQPTQCPGLCS